MVEDMDQNGIRTGVLSIASTPGVWFDLGPAEAGRSRGPAMNTPPT